jgi:hypothetical protein
VLPKAHAGKIILKAQGKGLKDGEIAITAG